MKPWNYLILIFLPVIVIAGYVTRGWWNYPVPVCCFAACTVANIYMVSSEDHAHQHNYYSVSTYNHLALSFVPALFLLIGRCLYIAGATVINTVMLFCHGLVALLSLIPPLWFKVMNKIISIHPLNTHS